MSDSSSGINAEYPLSVENDGNSPPSPYDRIAIATTQSLENGTSDPLIQALRAVNEELTGRSADKAEGYFKDREAERKILQREVDKYLVFAKKGIGDVSIYLDGVSRLILHTDHEGHSARIWNSSSQRIKDKWSQLNPDHLYKP